MKMTVTDFFNCLYYVESSYGFRKIHVIIINNTIFLRCNIKCNDKLMFAIENMKISGGCFFFKHKNISVPVCVNPVSELPC